MMLRSAFHIVGALGLLLMSACGSDRLSEDSGRAPESEPYGIGFRTMPEPSLEMLDANLAERIGRALRTAENPLPANGAIYQRADEVWEYEGDPEGGSQPTERALDEATRVGDLERVAQYLSDLGVFRAQASRLSEAVSLYHGALFLWQELERPLRWANTRLNLAVTYFRLGRHRDVLRACEQLAPYFESQGEDYLGEAALAWTQIGKVRFLQGRYVEAEEALNRALELRRRVGAPLGIASAFFARGRLRLEQGEHEAAERDLRRAEKLYDDEERQRLRAHTWLDLAELALVRSPPDHEAALRYLEGIDAYLADIDPRDEMLLSQYSGYLRAARLRDLGHVEKGVAMIESVLANVELQRSEAKGELYWNFFAYRLKYVDFLVGMEISRGNEERALAVTERARSRGLLEQVLRPRGDGIESPPIEYLRQRNHLRREIRSLAGDSRSTTDSAVAHLRALIDALVHVESEIERSAGGRPMPHLSSSEALASLEPGEMALAYWLGDEASWLFTVTANGVEEVVELPDRRRIAASVRYAQRLLARGDGLRRQAERELEQLSRLLLPRSLPETASTLLILADGPLSRLPFGLLSADGMRLGDRHAIARVPSLSVLAALRRRTEARSALDPPRALVVADPAYHADTWPRLPASRREAESLAQLFGGEGGSRLLLGEQASRNTFLAVDHSRFSHLHFGTHAELHPELPTLSAIHLGDRGIEGGIRDGALRLRDIRDLHLRSQVVTLAGCETALGETLRGEGTLALPRSFLYAGASSVVASLWAVEDAATAALIQTFYEGLIRDGLTPTQALRRARNHVASQSGWASPEHWGGFVLLGDPTAH